MDTTIESILSPHNSPPPAFRGSSTRLIFLWTQRLTLVAGIVGLAAYFLTQSMTTLVLSAACSLVAVSTIMHCVLRWRELKQTAARQAWQRYGHLTEVIHRIDDGFDVVSPVIPTIIINDQTLVVLRAWSVKTGKATLLLDQKGRAIEDPDIWRQSTMLIEFANACLPGVARNRRGIINTNQYAQNVAAKIWKRALKDNKDTFHHLGLAAEVQILLEHWDQLDTFLSLRLALFQAEESVVEQVEIPANDRAQIAAWIETQQHIRQVMGTLTPTAEKIARASARLLTGWLEHKTDPGWIHSEELESGLKYAYLFQSLVKRTLDHLTELNNPDLKTFQRGLDLAAEAGLMMVPSR